MQNLGIPGINTHNYLKFMRSDEMMHSLPPAKMISHVIFSLGANDSIIPEAGPALYACHVDLPDYGRNMVEIIELIRNRFPTAEILVVAPPKTHGMATRDDSVTQQYATLGK